MNRHLAGRYHKSPDRDRAAHLSDVHPLAGREEIGDGRVLAYDGEETAAHFPTDRSGSGHALEPVQD